MTLAYSPGANVAYLYLQEKRTQQLETVCVRGELNVDLLEDGSVYGIEFMNFKGQIADLVLGTLRVENLEAVGESEVRRPKAS